MLSDMDYKEKYEMALDRARVWKEKSGMPKDKQGILDDIFPELAESEDERIRKELTKHLKEGVEGYMPAGDSSDYRRWLDWLEKQGKSSDQIHYWTEEEIEPIISDYLRGAEHYGGMIARLRCLKPKSLEKQSEFYTKRDVDNAYIEGMASAKRELEKQGEQKLNPCDECINVKGCINCENGELRETEQKPAVKMKTPEESLGIDSDTYNEIVDKCIYGEQKSQRMISAEAKEAMYDKPSDKIEQKSSWTKEDDVRLQACIDTLQAKSICDKVDTIMTKWLKSLKDRVQPKQEWSEEDVYMLESIISDFAAGHKSSIGQDKWLKSIRPQNTWKPSDEQMADLWNMLCECRPADHQLLQDIYYGLKKLRENNL